jgi:hypothetical protein
MLPAAIIPLTGLTGYYLLRGKCYTRCWNVERLSGEFRVKQEVRLRSILACCPGIFSPFGASGERSEFSACQTFSNSTMNSPDDWIHAK